MVPLGFQMDPVVQVGPKMVPVGPKMVLLGAQMVPMCHQMVPVGTIFVAESTQIVLVGP